jgi:hypothetical protein
MKFSSFLFRVICGLLLLVTTANCCSGFNHRAEAPAGKPAYLLDSTVALVTGSPVNEFQYYTYCAGVWISPDQFLTAHHCIIHEEYETNMMGKMVRFKTRREVSISKNELTVSDPHYGVVVAIDSLHDLALVKSVDLGLEHSVAKIKESAVEVGEGVKIVGHTSGLTYTYIVGVVSAIRVDFPEDGDHYFQVSTPGYKGNSGGGLFDNDGNLMGICSSLFRGAPNVILFIHKDEMVKFLRENQI